MIQVHEAYAGANNFDMTARSALVLALHYGYGSLGDLVADIPENGSVIDAGAGHSPFAYTIAQKRPDVHVAAYDLRYGERWTVPELSNLEMISGDITDVLPADLLGGFDRVFSYGMLRHLAPTRSEALGSESRAMRGAANILALLSANGRARVGPVKGVRTVLRPFYDTLSVESAPADETTARQIVAATTRPSPYSRKVIAGRHRTR